MNGNSCSVQVKALVRQRDGSTADAIPPAVEVVVGDIGDMSACQEAVQGVDKVWCQTTVPVGWCSCCVCPLIGSLCRKSIMG